MSNRQRRPRKTKAVRNKAAYQERLRVIAVEILYSTAFERPSHMVAEIKARFGVQDQQAWNLLDQARAKAPEVLRERGTQIRADALLSAARNYHRAAQLAETSRDVTAAADGQARLAKLMSEVDVLGVADGAGRERSRREWLERLDAIAARAMEHGDTRTALAAIQILGRWLKYEQPDEAAAALPPAVLALVREVMREMPGDDRG